MPHRTYLIHTTDTSFSYTVKKVPRAKRIRITIHSDGTVVATGPRWVSQRAIKSFVETHAGWIAKKRAAYDATNIPSENNKEAYRQYKERARALITERVARFSSQYGFHVNRIYIRDTKTRWGSCSTKGNISFSYKLLFLSSELRDYVIIHELCHLRSFDHSPRFWKYVEKICPTYHTLRKELKHIGNLQIPNIDTIYT